MAKPRIIIADTDVSYIVPLQLRFVEEFFEAVDLEIITDPAFFEATFSEPQKADVLVVSEDLYESGLQRHNIGNIFVMMERLEDDSTDELKVDRIYKYTSIKEIFNEIVGKSAGALNVEYGNKSEPQIVLVYSAAGGVGKTTVAMGIAACLTQNYKKVLYINASWLQTFQRMLENKSVISDPEVYVSLAKAQESSIYNEIKHVLRKEQFTYLPPFKASLMSLGLDYSIYEKLALSAKKSKDFDYIIVDADSEFDDEKASLIEHADKAVIVTSQYAGSVYATKVLVSNINGISNDKYLFVCNDFSTEEDNALISSNISVNFSVMEYVEHIPHYDLLRAGDLVNSNGMKNVCMLVL